jgi:uncharacterized OB-fold protein
MNAAVPTGSLVAGTVLAPSETLSATLHAEPAPTSATQPFWAGAAIGRLVLPWCRTCEAWRFPPRRRCPHCWGLVDWRDASGRGRVSSYVIVRRPVDGIERSLPYVTAVARLDEGVDVMGNLVDVDLASMSFLDLPVEVVFHRAPSGRRLLAFRPLDAPP